MKKTDVLKNLEKLVGKEMSYDDVICAFEDFEENGETQVYVGKSNNSGYNYIAYIDTADATEFLICVDEENVITDVKMN